eukprot:11133031-Lingulodinium_polyedra.AAC.1
MVAWARAVPILQAVISAGERPSMHSQGCPRFRNGRGPFPSANGTRRAADQVAHCGPASTPNRSPAWLAARHPAT